MRVHFRSQIKQMLSFMIIISTMLILVFAKTETRRLGYNVYRLVKVERLKKDDLRQKQMTFAKLTRPERIELLAQTKLELREPRKGQIIQLVAGQLALEH